MRCVRDRKFECPDCRREFSVISGTVFAFHILSFWKMLTAIWMSVNAANGHQDASLWRSAHHLRWQLFPQVTSRLAGSVAVPRWALGGFLLGVVLLSPAR